MRIPRIRISVRWLMLIVAILAISAWGVRMWSLAAHYRRLEGLHATNERESRLEAANHDGTYRDVLRKGSALIFTAQGNMARPMTEEELVTHKAKLREKLRIAERRAAHF